MVQWDFVPTPVYINLGEYTNILVLYDKHTITTEIRSGYYIYTLERSFCLMINIMIDIRSGMGRLHVKCNRLRLRALQGFTITITITITAILDVIDYDCDYIGM